MQYTLWPKVTMFVLTKIGLFGALAFQMIFVAISSLIQDIH